MNRKQLKEQAKEQIKGSIGLILLMFITLIGITGILAAIPGVGPLLAYVAGAVFDISFAMIFIFLSNNVIIQYENLFAIFKNTRLCGNAILLSILVTVYTFLWSLLFIVPGIIKSISYSMSPYILAENEDYTASDAIKESMRIMDGHKMEYFILELSFLGWDILTILTFGLVGIYLLPYRNTTIANFYNSVKDKPDILPEDTDNTN